MRTSFNLWIETEKTGRQCLPTPLDCLDDLLTSKARSGLGGRLADVTSLTLASPLRGPL
jgi:hypothetical protein